MSEMKNLVVIKFFQPAILTTPLSEEKREVFSSPANLPSSPNTNGKAALERYTTFPIEFMPT